MVDTGVSGLTTPPAQSTGIGIDATAMPPQGGVSRCSFVYIVQGYTLSWVQGGSDRYPAWDVSMRSVMRTITRAVLFANMGSEFTHEP